MKATFRDALISNLISLILIFILLNIFDHSGETVRNIVIVFIGFLLLTGYDFIKIRFINKDKK